MSADRAFITEYNFFRDFIVGKTTFIQSWTLYKRVLLTGQVALFGVFYSLLNVVLGLIEGFTTYVPYYLALALICVICNILLRTGFYVTGRVVLIMGSLILVSLFALLDRSDPSVYFFYFVITIGSMTIFGYERITLGFIFSALVVVTFIIVFFSNIGIANTLTFSEEFSRRTFALNFITAVMLSVLMIYYMIMINYQIITDLRNKEQDLINMTNELSESRNRFELAIRGSAAGIWDWDPVTDSLYLSPLLGQILGYRDSDLRGASQRSFYDVVHPEDLPEVTKKLEDHLKKNTKFEVELRIRNKSGEYIWVLDTGQAEWDSEGNPVRMVGSMVDITERKLAEELLLEKKDELEKANKELDRFVYSVSHDLKSPLSSVLGLITIAEMSDETEEIKKCVSMMRTRVDQLSKFIEEIIEFARYSRSEIHHDDHVEVRSLVDGVIENFAYLDNRGKIDIRNEVDASCTLGTDMGRLRIVLNNLIGNAIKYHDFSKEYPFIRIACEKGENEIRILVQDNGTGIDRDLQEKVFEMFYRASQSSDGSGLGLYIARDMMNDLKGSLSLESEPGQGSTFLLTIPISEAEVK